MIRMAVPSSRRWVAKLWCRVCGPTRLAMSAARAADAQRRAQPLPPVLRHRRADAGWSIPEPWYDADQAVRRVRPTGKIKWRGDLIFVSEAVAGEPAGIAETENGNWIVRFCDLDLGVIDRKTGKLHRFADPRPGRGRARPEQTEETVTHVTGP
jgi:hypothetical protein